VVEQVVVEVFVHEEQHNYFDELDVLGRVDVCDCLLLAGPEQNASRGRTQRARTQGQGCRERTLPTHHFYPGIYPVEQGRIIHNTRIAY
jgi:hypothetical protein